MDSTFDVMLINKTIADKFGTALNSPKTQYFIFDTNGKKHEDKDFEEYPYRKERYNLVREGDLFIYRRPAKSTANGQFHFFGCGRVGRLSYLPLHNGQTRVIAHVDHPLAFDKWVFQDDILEYEWEEKKRRGSSYEHFFSNYGMNKITRKDFIYLTSLALEDDGLDEEMRVVEVELTQSVQEENYSAEDKRGSSKIRGAAQRVFSNKLREIYNSTCCVTGIKTASLLVGSHIVPWSERKDIRLDPRNGLLLSALMDKLFDAGLMVVDTNYRVCFDSRVKADPSLYAEIKKYDGKKITLPATKYRPKKEYLEYRMTQLLEK